jgi:hypothetical protein
MFEEEIINEKQHMREKIIDCPYYNNKKADVDINRFHLIKTITFRHFSHLFFIEKVDRSWRNFLFKLFFSVLID